MKQSTWYRLGGIALMMLALNAGAADKPIHQGIVDDYKADKVSDHVYVIHGPAGQPNKENQGFINNPAFIVTDEEVAVIDPGSSSAIGRAVLAHIRKITDKPVTKVLITHVHGDHWLGNEAFKEESPDTKFYASAAMIEAANEGAGDTWVEIMDNLTEKATAGTNLVIPTEVLEHGQEVKIGGLTLRTHFGEKAHSASDLMFELVEDKLLLTGDTVSNKRIIRMDDGSFLGNIKATEYAASLDVDVVVPGHGQTGDKSIISAYQGYLSGLYNNVKEMREDFEPYEMKPMIAEKLDDYKEWHGLEEELGKHISLSVLEAEQEDF